MLTADTITDEQIRELRERCSENGEGADDGHGGYYAVAEMLNMCDEALGDFEYGDTFVHLPMARSLALVEERRVWSRSRCAEILNTRARLDQADQIPRASASSTRAPKETE